jgi:hypothetical protein
LVNLYRYDCEEFHYENGRLLLRGNNGTGKSRFLALQLPFLLDGELHPQRLEPDADPSKKAEWNLLMGRYPERTGYTWIEFGRREDSAAGGKDHYLTLGCGLAAIQGQTGVRQWFFITTQRIGQDLDLVSRTKQVLDKDRLREKIGPAGRLFEAAGPYRRAVNEALFRLDEYRYASLVNLLIQLRRPQLTRRLDEHELSRALSEALPPVSPEVIASAAEAFQSLESDRVQLLSSKAALAAVEQFLSVYRRYAEVAAKRRADRVIAAHYEYEAGMKEILSAEAECDRSLVELGRLKTELQRLALEQHAVESEITAFRQTAALTGAHGLEQAEREAVERRKDAAWAAEELTDAARLRKSWVDEHLRLRTNLDQCQSRLAAAAESAAQAASSAGLERMHAEVFGPLNLHAAGETALQQARDTIADAIRRQSEKMAHAAKLHDRVVAARNQFQQAGAERDQLSGIMDDAREQLHRARGEHRSAITAFLGAAAAWTADLAELPLPFDDAFLRSVTEWCEKPHGPNPFAVAGRKAVLELAGTFAETRAGLKQFEKNQTDEMTRLETERESLVSAESPALELDQRPHDRIAVLQAAIAEAEARLDPIIDSLEELNRRESILRSEAQAAPADEGVRAAYDYAVAMARHVDSLRRRLAEADENADQRRLHLAKITEDRDRAVVDLGLGKWLQDLDALKNGISDYRFALASLWQAGESLQQAQTASESAWMHLEHANAREARQKEVAAELERRAIAAEIVRDSAAQTAGSDIGDIVERIAAARERLESLRREEKEIRLRYHDKEVAVTRLDERLRSRTAMLNAETDRRNIAACSLQTFASTGVLQLAVAGVAGPDVPSFSTTHAVELAFELASQLASIDAADAAWENLQRAVPSQFNSLMQALSAQGCQSSATFRDDVFVATALHAGQERSIDELRQLLAEDAGARRMLLDAREREILENYLLGKISSHLQGLLLGAEEQVRQMNIELENRPMSTGMKLRFVWQPAEDAPAGMVEARQRLMQAKDTWSADERRILGAFLHNQIQAAGSDMEGGSWQEALAGALDYRRWHGFGVERYQEGVWKRLTQRTHGTGSGGEKAVALTLPHFAAAAAFYRTADALAPRLILLDEAFVGIDANMRAKCMGLIHTFDLDFIMTSEREWGCYQTLPGLAIYQLSTRPGIDAIGLTRWVWNGRNRNLWHTTITTDDVREEGAMVAIGSQP